MARGPQPQSLFVSLIIFGVLCGQVASSCPQLRQGAEHFQSVMIMILFATVMLLSLLYAFAKDHRTTGVTMHALNDFTIAFLALSVYSKLNAEEVARTLMPSSATIGGGAFFVVVYVALVVLLWCLAHTPRYLHCVSPIANHVAGLSAIFMGSTGIQMMRNDYDLDDYNHRLATWLCIAIIIVFFVYVQKVTTIIGNTMGHFHSANSKLNKFQRRERRMAHLHAAAAGAEKESEVAHEWHEACTELFVDALAACLGCVLSQVCYYHADALVFDGKAGDCNFSIECSEYFKDYRSFVYWLFWTFSVMFVSWYFSERHAPAPRSQVTTPETLAPSPGHTGHRAAAASRAASPAPRVSNTAVQPVEHGAGHGAHGHGAGHEAHDPWHQPREVLHMTCSFSAAWGLLFAAKYVCLIWLPKFSGNPMLKCVHSLEELEFVASLILALCSSFFLLFIVFVVTVMHRCFVQLRGKAHSHMREYVPRSFCLFAALVWDQVFEAALEHKDSDFMHSRWVSSGVVAIAILYVYAFYLQPGYAELLHEKHD